MENTLSPSTKAGGLSSGLKTFGLGLLFFAVAFYFFTTITNFENGEAVRMNRLLVFAYEVLGKNLTTCLLALGGGLYAYFGIEEMIRSRRF